jgi:predicted transcriptional regulator
MSAIAQEKHIQDIGEIGGIGGKEIDLRVIPESEAKKVIKKYIREHPGCITSDIIENLNLDPALAVQALNLLEEEGKVRGEEVE